MPSPARQQELERYAQIIKSIDVQGNQAKVQKAWGEGTFHANQYQQGETSPAMLWVMSDSYPWVNFFGKGANTWLQIMQGHAFVNTNITSDKIEVSTHPIFKMDEVPRDLGRLVREQGLERGLKSGLDFYSNQVRLEPVSIHPEDEGIAKKYSDAIQAIIDIGKTNKSYPSDIRELTTDIVGQLPGSLEPFTFNPASGKRIDIVELTSWAHERRGARRGARLRDQILARDLNLQLAPSESDQTATPAQYIRAAVVAAVDIGGTAVKSLAKRIRS